MEAQSVLSERMRLLIQDMRAQWCELDRRIAALDAELAEWARNEEAARRLMTIPGIGGLNASALITDIGRDESFTRGATWRAWLGLVPRQVTAGGRPHLLGISKRGNKYLRHTKPVPYQQLGCGIIQDWSTAHRHALIGLRCLREIENERA